MRYDGFIPVGTTPRVVERSTNQVDSDQVRTWVLLVLIAVARLSAAESLWPSGKAYDNEHRHVRFDTCRCLTFAFSSTVPFGVNLAYFSHEIEQFTGKNTP